MFKLSTLALEAKRKYIIFICSFELRGVKPPEEIGRSIFCVISAEEERELPSAPNRALSLCYNKESDFCYLNCSPANLLPYVNSSTET